MHIAHQLASTESLPQQAELLGRATRYIDDHDR